MEFCFLTSDNRIVISMSQSIVDFDQSGKTTTKEMALSIHSLMQLKRFKRGMKTWGKWLDENIDHWKSMVLYRAYSAAHFRNMYLVLKLRSELCTLRKSFTKF